MKWNSSSSGTTRRCHRSCAAERVCGVVLVVETDVREVLEEVVLVIETDVREVLEEVVLIETDVRGVLEEVVLVLVEGVRGVLEEVVLVVLLVPKSSSKVLVGLRAQEFQGTSKVLCTVSSKK